MFSNLTQPRVLMGTSALATLAIAVGLTQNLGLLDRTSGYDGYESAVDELSGSSFDDLARSDADGRAGGGQGVVATQPVPLPSPLPQPAETRSQADAAASATSGEAALSGVRRREAQELNRLAAAPEPMVEAEEAPESDMAFAAPPPAPSAMAPGALAGSASGLMPELADRGQPLAQRKIVSPDDQVAVPPAVESNTEQFPEAQPSPVKQVSAEPVSTFSIDVDTAAYGVVRSSLNGGYMPPAQAVRVEEMINYFDYSYPAPETREVPFQTSVSVAPTPWNADTQLLHIGIQGYDLPVGERPPLNLVFLIDTSGSMNDANKLPLLINSFKLLLETLSDQDSIAIVTYAGSAGMALEPTPASDSVTILGALDRLSAGGSTAGQAGLQQAYALAERMGAEGEISRVILATDGDFNVGISDPEALKRFVEDKRESGTYLSVLGFGRGNYNDSIMQSLAQNGNGTAAYIDTLAEAQKVLVEDMTGAMFPIAGDVKIQIEFNPAQISEYRLIGYETRALKREDFSNDAVDAGEIGAGHSVTAIYEITPKGSPAELVSDLRYGQAEEVQASDPSAEYAFLKLRYKLPGEDVSTLIETPVMPDRADIAAEDTAFAAAVAGFGRLLRGESLGGWDYSDARELAASARGDDPYGYRSELVNLIRLADALD